MCIRDRSYTMTNAKFLTDFGSTQDIWGEVSNGDRIPYIPQHQLNSSFCFLSDIIDLNINELTPVEALLKLNEIKKLISK